MRQNVGEYINNGSDSNRGLTWTYVARTPYAGAKVRWDNKRELLEQGMREYKRKNPDASVLECWLKGKNFVNRQKKHEKAYIKGLNFYKYKGGIYPVEDMSRMEAFIEAAKAYNERVEAKMAEDKLSGVELSKTDE